MPEAKLIANDPDSGLELRYAHSLAHTWPGHDPPLGKRGYWMGTAQRHEHVPGVRHEALRRFHEQAGDAGVIVDGKRQARSRGEGGQVYQRRYADGRRSEWWSVKWWEDGKTHRKRVSKRLSRCDFLE